MQEKRRRSRIPGLHIQIGRRYKHTELTQKRPTQRSRRAAKLMRTGLDAVQAAYGDLDAEMQKALHDAVVRLLRPEVSAEWTEEQAQDRALAIARELMEAPLPEN